MQNTNSKRTGPEEVADFFANLDHPLKGEMEKVREIILNCGKAITEHVKWKAPSFCHNGDDRLTFNVLNDRILLIFHRGARVKDSSGRGRLIDDTTGLLEWHSDDRASLKITEDQGLDYHKLKKLVSLWLEAASNHRR